MSRGKEVKPAAFSEKREVKRKKTISRKLFPTLMRLCRTKGD